MSEKEEEATLFKKFSDLMDQNTKGVQIGCYSIAIIGLSYALRRVRPFSRFKKPSDIPTQFIKERRELIGTVQRVEPNGVLLINHKPLIPLPFIKNGELPTKISKVEVNGHGVSWLQILVTGNEVKFVPVSKKNEFVECQIKLPQTIIEKKQKKEKVIDIGVSLVSIGFGTLVEDVVDKKDKNYKYYTQLMSAREHALRKKMGIKYYVKPTRLILAAIIHQLNIATKTISRRLWTKTVTPPKPVAA